MLPCVVVAITWVGSSSGAGRGGYLTRVPAGVSVPDQHRRIQPWNFVYLAPREEQMMCESFGEEYRNYMRQTGRLFPRMNLKNDA